MTGVMFTVCYLSCVWVSSLMKGRNITEIVQIKRYILTTHTVITAPGEENFGFQTIELDLVDLTCECEIYETL